METNLRGSRGDRTTIVRLCSCDNKLCLRCRRYVYLTQCSERGRRPSASLQCFRIITRYQRHELAVTAVAARRPDVSYRRGYPAEDSKRSIFWLRSDIRKMLERKLGPFCTMCKVSSRLCLFPRSKNKRIFRWESRKM